MERILKIQNLSLIREGRKILEDLNLVLNSGQIHALLGMNGSGKSSLAYAIMGCEGYSPDSGQIIFDGQELNNLSITERARLGITLAWQEPARFEGIPVGKYVGLGLKKPDKQKVISAFEAVALPANTYGFRSADKTLSGGERKRVELAAVYAMKPRLAILDEPDSGVDILSLDDISRLIHNLAENGTAILLITHRKDFIDTADVASLMCAGTIIFNGDPHKTRLFFEKRCMPHIEKLGTQPWDESLPEVQAAFASNGELRSSNKDSKGNTK